MKYYGILTPVIEQLESWTVDDAAKATKEWLINGESAGDPSNPIAQWSAWHERLPALQQQYEQGDSKALLKALEICALHGLPLPPWGQQSYLNSWRKAKSYECRTLDEAFEYEVKGTNLARAREGYQNSLVVAILIAREIRSGATVEQALQTVSKNVGISFSRAREWFYLLRQHSAVAAYLPAKSEICRKD